MTLPIIGHEFRVVGDVKLRFTPAGAPVTEFRAVCNKKKLNRETNQWEDDKTLWVQVNCWYELAQNVASSVNDKDLVVVSGEIHTRQYTKENGEKKISVEIEASAVGPSLRFVETQSRPGATRDQGQGNQQRQAPQQAYGQGQGGNPDNGWGPQQGGQQGSQPPQYANQGAPQGGQQGGGSWGPQQGGENEPPF